MLRAKYSPEHFYWCDYCYKNTGNRYLIRGGHCHYGFHCGVFYIFLGNFDSNTGWGFGASLSYKPVERDLLEIIMLYVVVHLIRV